MWLVRKVPEDSIRKRLKEYLCGSGPRIYAYSWFRQKYFQFVDRKKNQTIGIDPIFKYRTLCDIAVWKCGLWEKFQKIRFREDGRIIYAVPVQGWMPIVDSVRNSSGLLMGEKSGPSDSTQFWSSRHVCEIALRKCGLWEKFQKIRFGRDGRNIYSGSGPRIDADSWFRWKYIRFVDRKKIQTIAIDPIFKYRTLCDIAVWKCGLWEKFQKIRFREDGRIIYAAPVQI